MFVVSISLQEMVNVICAQIVPITAVAQRPVYGQIVRERKIKRSTHAHVSTCSVSLVEPGYRCLPEGIPAGILHR